MVGRDAEFISKSYTGRDLQPTAAIDRLGSRPRQNPALAWKRRVYTYLSFFRTNQIKQSPNNIQEDPV